MTTAGVPSAANAKRMPNAVVALAAPAKVAKIIPLIGKRHWMPLNFNISADPTIATSE